MTATTAIVIGTGIGGLVCAEVLCNHFDSVLVLEKDTAAVDLLSKTSLDAAKLESKARPGVPQVRMQLRSIMQFACAVTAWYLCMRGWCGVLVVATCIKQTPA